MRPLVLAFILAASSLPSLGQSVSLKDAYPDKARYAPSEQIILTIELDGLPLDGQSLSAVVTDLSRQVGVCDTIKLTAKSSAHLSLSCKVSSPDFHGYMVSVNLRGTRGEVLSSRQTAVDISSDWKRFPRYGYLAHYNPQEGAQPRQWVDELNKFHINGLEFYDFQYRHDQPLAGTVEHPDASWRDIAGRTIDADIVRGFIDNAHLHHMMAMAYNASYSAYDDVFTRSKPLPLQWATWDTSNGERTAETARSLPMHIPNETTSRLYYMNQNSVGWQDYLSDQMTQLFEVYPFDGWHIDTFGDKGGFAYDRSPVVYVSGFKPFIDHVHDHIGKPVVFNAVNTLGQETIATSAAEFVYSELWEDHETFASILELSEQVRLANPAKAYVIAAYLGRNESKDAPSPDSHDFNTPSVLLTDAAIFASGASHIELGDGRRMLSSEYFPADTRLHVTDQLAKDLRHYYDFATAYESYLRDGMSPAVVDVSIHGQQVDTLGVPNAIWSIARQKGEVTTVHLINLLGSDDPHWRDVALSRPDAPLLNNVQVSLQLTKQVESIGWASPDKDGGQFHSLKFESETSANGERILVTLPSLKYWDALFITTK